MPRTRSQSKKGKQSKKKWSKLTDSTKIIQQINEQKSKIKERESLKQTLNLDSLYTIDNKPSKRIKKLLNKDRFKKKIYVNKNYYEVLEIKRLQRKMKKGMDIVKKKKVVKEEDTMVDLWADDFKVEGKLGRQARKRTKGKGIKAIRLPHPGQSYNPQFSAYQNLIDTVVSAEISKDFTDTHQDERHQKKLERQRKKDAKKFYRGRTKKEILQNEAHRLAKQEKHRQHSVLLIKKYKKEIDQRNALQRERIKKRREMKQRKEEMLLKQGVVQAGEKHGFYKYKMIDEEFVGEDDLKEKVSQVKANDNLIREAFDNYLRRGMIDPIHPTKGVKDRRVPKFKHHTANPIKAQQDIERQKNKGLQQFA